MRRIFGQIPLLLVIILTGCDSPKIKIYDARVQEKEILTPAVQKAPRINGPKVYGVRPGKKFLYRIPSQGERPIQFSVEGLPDGLILESNNGIISGIVPSERGEYKMTLTIKNIHGKASRSFKIIVGDKMCLTPPVGWNAWGGHLINVTDELIRKAADVFVEEGLADVGFQYLSIDDCWMKTSPGMYANRRSNVVEKHKNWSYEGVIGDIRDADGNIIPNHSFPDMKAMCDYIHSYGLKAGIYSTPGPLTCQDMAGSYGHEKQDAEQYAHWGFDLLKYDLCSGGIILRKLKEEDSTYQDQDFWKPMVEYLGQQEQDILYNLCQYGRDEPWTWAPEIGIQTWRIGGDLNHDVRNYFRQALRIAIDLREFSKPGQWNDPDFMYIHRIRDVWKMIEPSEEIVLNTNERYQYVTLWSIICAPFFFSCDILEIDDFTIGLLANADVVNINQDELGHVAEVIKNNEYETVMVKELADGSKVLAVFNRSTDTESVVKVSWSEISESGRRKVYDVWRQKEIGTYKDEISVHLSADGVGLFVIS